MLRVANLEWASGIGAHPLGSDVQAPGVVVLHKVQLVFAVHMHEVAKLPVSNGGTLVCASTEGRSKGMLHST
jgi:hypothetical protein